jgi:hypothetical protein
MRRYNHHHHQQQGQQHLRTQKKYMSFMENDERVAATTTTSTSDAIKTNNIHHNNNNNNNGMIQFLGKGTDAIVRLGVVLVSPHNEFHHFYRQAAIYIYAMGYDDTMPLNEDGTSTYYIRGVILDHPTPFTVHEMIPSLSTTDILYDTTTGTSNTPTPSLLLLSSSSSSPGRHPLASNLIFRGGDKGRENSVLLLHNQKNIPGCSEEIGTSGLYHGGFDYIASCHSRSSSSNSSDGGTDNNSDIDMDGNNFKFFFNYCEFTEDEIEELFASTEDGDAWASVQIHDPSIILNEEWDRGDCWRYIRNGIVSQMKESE